MSDDPQSMPEAPATPALDLDALGARCAEALGTALGDAVALPVRIEADGGERTPAEALWGSGGARIGAWIGLACKDRGALHVLLERADAQLLCGLLAGEEGEALAERRERPWDRSAAAAIAPLLESAAAGAAAAVAEACAGEAASFGDLAHIEDARALAARLGDGSCERLRLRVGVEGFEDAHCDIVIAASAPRSAAGLCGLVIIDADPDAHAEAEPLGRALGCPLAMLEPGELDADDLEAFMSADAVVVAWHLGALCGLEWLEQLRSDPRLRALPVALADAAPTAAMVRTALEQGASSFVRKPYDAQELRSRLQLRAAAAGGDGGASAEPSEAAAPAGEA